MKQNNSNHIDKYEDIFAKLETSLNEYLTLNSGRNVKGFNLSQKGINTDGFENKLIESGLSPKELIAEIRDSYLRRDYLEGEVGTIDGEEQYDGIFNIALSMLISNRLAKWYKYEIEKKSNLDKTTKAEYEEKIKKFMSEKKQSAMQLMYSLFIYKETVNDNDFFYGHSLDINDKDTFVIDLPVYGQISVHFGSAGYLDHIKHLASNNIKLILEKKLKLGQITKKEYNKLKNKVDDDEIFPEYTGKLYEHSSAIPIDYQGRNFKRAQKDLKLSKKMIVDYTEEDIERISKNKKYNSRELYFWAVKSDFSKKQLEQLSAYLQERDNIALSKIPNKTIKKTIDVQSVGKKVVSSTTAEERKQVSSHESKIYIVDRRKNIVTEKQKEKE